MTTVSALIALCCSLTAWAILVRAGRRERMLRRRLAAVR
jgi:hypothetical protein